jgi:hypothetical protein
MKRAIKNYFIRLVTTIIFFVGGVQFSTAQNVIATLKADSSTILIGDKLNVKFTINFPAGTQISLPKIKDSIGTMDVVSVSEITKAEKVWSQVIAVSAYDSGDYRLGPVAFVAKDASGKIDTIVSTYEFIRVNTLDVDTTQPFKVIKAPMDMPWAWDEFSNYIYPLAFLIMLIIAGIIMYREQKHKKKSAPDRFVPKDPAHVWARKELKKLEEEKLWQKDEHKQYYTRLTDILRLYLEYRYRWLALEETTEEIAARLELYPINDIAKKLLLDTLRNGDLVKFAKMAPMPDVNTKAMQNALEFIEITKPAEEQTSTTKNNV